MEPNLGRRRAGVAGKSHPVAARLGDLRGSRPRVGLPRAAKHREPAIDRPLREGVEDDPFGGE